MSAGRPRIEGYAIISNEGMIATSDGDDDNWLKQWHFQLDKPTTQ